MADHFVRALYGTASNMKASQPRRGIVELLRQEFIGKPA